MGIVLSLVFFGFVLIILMIVWMINGAESRNNAHAASQQLRDARTVHTNAEPERGTGID